MSCYLIKTEAIVIGRREWLMVLQYEGIRDWFDIFCVYIYIHADRLDKYTIIILYMITC
jgi:hypothetical protein